MTKFIILQTNDSPDFDGHINICNSLDDMKDKYPKRSVKYAGSLKTPVYTRFMQVGYKGDNETYSDAIDKVQLKLEGLSVRKEYYSDCNSVVYYLTSSWS